jgi:hypothetical protein
MLRAKPSARAFVLRIEPLRVSPLRASIAFAIYYQGEVK